ncbi:MAG: Kazal-type serine protease inhibitor family protein [Kofleriaceae bacterium]
MLAPRAPRLRLAACSLLTLSLGACAAPKDDGKGVLDDSAPPQAPSAEGKGDESSQLVPIAIESAHPYANDTDASWTVDLSVVPSCATRARLRFAALQTEANYDYVVITAPDGSDEWFDGNVGPTASAWFDLTGAPATVTLLTDESITRHGFAIDAIEWDRGADACPLWPLQPCPEGSLSIQRPTGTCECPPPPTCVAIGEVELTHVTARGRNYQAKHTVGLAADATSPGPDDGPVTRDLGTITVGALEALLDLAVVAGAVRPGYDTSEPGVFFESFTIKAGAHETSFVAPIGEHSPEVTTLIAAFEAALGCDGDGAALTCGAGLTCEEAACVPESTCVCPAVYDPVCGVDGRTYSNACAAGCASMPVAHDDECGQPGDMCGGLLGWGCADEGRCRFDESLFEVPFPDAAGTCVPVDYCDAARDCDHLPHVAVPGQWACEANACEFVVGSPWHDADAGVFETAHPYANSTSVWHQVWLPDGASSLRLVASGAFELEAGYDYLEVWTWQLGRWVRVARFTGTVGPDEDAEFAGQYHYLRLVTDSSVVRHGFAVAPQWR